MYKHWPSRKDRVSSVADLVHRITGLRYIREFFLCKKMNISVQCKLAKNTSSGGGGNQSLRGRNMLSGYICMEKIKILWSDCESWGGKRPSCPLTQPPLSLGKASTEVLAASIVTV